MQITIIPIGTGSPGVGHYVADIISFLEKEGIEHVLHDMGTLLSGTTDELLQLARELHRIPFRRGAQRVVTSITLDERSDLERKIGEKTNAVVQLLHQKEALET